MMRCSLQGVMLLVALLLMVVSTTGRHLVAHDCPGDCICPPNQEINCQGKNLFDVPTINSNLSYITSWDLSNNNITVVPRGAFQKVPSLRFLNLEHNRIRYISSLTFNGLDSLKKLHLDHNKLTELKPILFSFNPALTHLSLRGNPLNVSVKLPSSATLNHLDLRGCHFTVLPSDFLPRLLQLQTLYLTDNDLEHLPHNFFDNFPNLKQINLKNNPWRCSDVEKLFLSKKDIIGDFHELQCVTSDRRIRKIAENSLSETTQIPLAATAVKKCSNVLVISIIISIFIIT